MTFYGALKSAFYKNSDLSMQGFRGNNTYVLTAIFNTPFFFEMATIAEGFCELKATGICSLDPNVFLKGDFAAVNTFQSDKGKPF
jgi:hypothetical protein